MSDKPTKPLPELTTALRVTLAGDRPRRATDSPRMTMSSLRPRRATDAPRMKRDGDPR